MCGCVRTNVCLHVVVAFRVFSLSLTTLYKIVEVFFCGKVVFLMLVHKMFIHVGVCMSCALGQPVR